MALAAVVPKKGPTDYACNELKRFLFEIGRTHAVLQADQEPAIQALARRVSAEVGIPLRKSPAYSSQSLGSAERWHRQMWSLLRVIKETVKENYKIDLTPSHPIMTWN